MSPDKYPLCLLRSDPVTNPCLEGLRKWSVKGFEKHLIFYLSVDNYIEIVRILHAARDIEAILERQEGE